MVRYKQKWSQSTAFKPCYLKLLILISQNNCKGWSITSVSEGDSGPCILGLFKTRLLLFILVDMSHDFSGNGNYCI